MLKMKVQNQNCRLKVDTNTTGIDVVIGICRLYHVLFKEGISKKDIDWQVNEVLKGMKEQEKESESAK